ncbi:MAG: FAD-dependent monooxygenase, partial [Candidatus Accumulibacter sp.]|nr:FAD-dependent monooxygenase [Accumulibacter sp.]
MTEAPETVDIAIVGAGPVGMALALALANGPYRVLLIDSRGPAAWAGDPRALALSHGTRQLLEILAAWNGNAATAIRTIHVSQRGGFGRTLIEATDYGIPALGYVMRYRDLAATLDERIDTTLRLNDRAVVAVSSTRAHAQITLAGDGETRRLAARLV